MNIPPASLQDFQTLITGLPTTAQSTTLYPGTMTTTKCNPGDAGAICTSATGVGAYFMMSCCTGFESGNHPNITATNYALPAGIPAGNVTTVYNCIQGFATSSGGFWDMQPLLINQTITPQKTYCDGGTPGSGYDYATASVSLSHDGVGSPTGFAYFVPFLLVVYTGTPITNNFVQIAPPLTYSGTTIGLMTGMPAPPVWDTGTANAYVGVTTSITTVATGQPLILAAGHANTGASTLQLNTVTTNIVKCGGAALVANDIVTNAPAFLLKQENATWLLTDPQTGCGGSSTGINQLTGDVTAGPGSGSQAATLAASGVTPGSYTNSNITVDAKGRVTSASNGSGGGLTVGSTPISGGSSGNGLYDNAGVLGEKAFAPALTACSDESSTFTPASGNCYFVTASVSTATPAASAFVLFTITTSSAGSIALTGTTIADGGSCSSYISGSTLTLTASQSVTVLSDGTNIRAKCTAAGSGGGLSGQTVNSLPLATSSTASTTSSIVSQSSTTSITINTTGTAYGVTLPEGTALTPTTGQDILYSDSTNHVLRLSTNGGIGSPVCTASNGQCASSVVPAWNRYTFVADSTAASVTSPAMSVTTGDILMVSCRYGIGTNGTATDSASNTYTSAVNHQESSSLGDQLSVATASTTASITFTCTQSSSAAGISLVAMDFGTAGATVDITASGNGVGSPAFTTTQKDLIVYCTAIGALTSYPLTLIGSGWNSAGVSGSTIAATNADQGCAYIVTTGLITGGANPFTPGSVTNAMNVVAAFKY